MLLGKVLGHSVSVVGAPLGTALGSLDGTSECTMDGVSLGIILGNELASTEGKLE